MPDGRRFVSRQLAPAGDGFVTPATGGEPPVPRAFIFERATLTIASIVRTWRSSKNDRGDTYLKRHWFELETDDGKRLEVYYDRAAARGQSPWWLYTIKD